MSNYQVEFITGKVLNQQKHVETHVYSQGGGGYVGPNGGRVKAPEVKSYTTTRHDIFFILENGREVSVSFPFDNIMLRDGHIITLFSAFRDAASSGYYVRLLNHNTDVTYDVTTKENFASLTKEEPTGNSLKWGCLFSLIVLIIGAILSKIGEGSGASNFASVIVIALVVFGVGYQKYNSSRQFLIKKSESELNARIREAIARFNTGNNSFLPA